MCTVENNLQAPITELVKELAVVNLVAIADAYRSGIMAYILRKDSTIIKKSKLDMSYSDIIDIGNWEELYSKLVHKTTEEWLGNGYGVWITKMKEKILPNINIQPENRLQIEEIVATRNTIIHNKGMVDSEYLRRSDNWYGFHKIDPPAIMTKRNLDESYYKSSSRCFKTALKEIDSQIVITFGIK